MTLNIRRRCQVVKAGVCKTPIQRFESARRLHPFSVAAGVAELADAEDLKSSALKRLVGSRPSPGRLVSSRSFQMPDRPDKPISDPHSDLQVNGAAQLLRCSACHQISLYWDPDTNEYACLNAQCGKTDKAEELNSG